MQITEQNVVSVARSLAKTLIEAGYKMMRSSYEIGPKEISYQDMQNLITQKLQCEAGLLDGKYYLEKIDTWKQIIASDWLVETKKYIAEKYDCDNFAYCFASHVSELYDISVATCYGRITNVESGNTDLHYWNTIFTKEDDGTFHVYFFDPQNNQLKEVVPGEKLVMGNSPRTWYYEPIKCIVF